MFELAKLYRSPHGYQGIGSDIKWCNRWRGGKFCMYCRHHAGFSEWSDSWHWYYICDWQDYYYGWIYREYAHYKVPQLYLETRWMKRWNHRSPIPEVPRYRTTGINESKIKSLLRKGCKHNRKCKCMSVAQRASWYCPTCYQMMNRMARHYKRDFHDITVVKCNDLKEDVLVLLLSGTI